MTWQTRPPSDHYIIAEQLLDLAQGQDSDTKGLDMILYRAAIHAQLACAPDPDSGRNFAPMQTNNTVNFGAEPKQPKLVAVQCPVCGNGGMAPEYDAVQCDGAGLMVPHAKTTMQPVRSTDGP